MAIIKCKMCGGDLNIIEGASTAECEFCGSVQTIPRVDDEKKLTLFARANRLRASCEFDKAAGIYESVVADFPEEAEAYWGLVLCKYGIEYVDDPGTGKKIPTCHRSSYDSVMDDGNFEQAMENADIVAQKVYREEAKAIERIRKGILEVSSKEQPYDIFICYKETAPNGDRTLDSVLAQDLYSALTDKGYRVFFSRITLQGKLGEAYEPYIFAALNSAKVMLAVGTCYEYYNAVWVKNEWSRYLKICEADKSKHLIPCYKNLDPEDMPKEFNHLQGADLGKMGAIQDILFNMEKYIPLKKQTTTVIQEKVVVGGSGNNKIVSLLDRGNMALEDGDWAKADSFFEDVLNNDSKNAQAYLGKALATEKCRTIDAFARKRKDATQNVRSEKKQISPNTAHIEKIVEQYTVAGYVEGQTICVLYDFDLSYHSEAAGRREQYKAEETYWLNHKWLSKAEKFAVGTVAEHLQREKKALFAALSDRVKQAETDETAAKKKVEERYAQHITRADTEAEKLYNDGMNCREADYQKLLQIAKISSDVAELTETAKKFAALGSYQDSKNLAEHCRKRAAEEQVKLDAEAERHRVQKEKQRKARQAKIKMISIISAAAIVIVAVAALVITQVIIPGNNYNQAVALLENGQYEEAISAFEAMNGYRDCDEMIIEAQNRMAYEAAEALLSVGNRTGAMEAFSVLGSYSDSAQRITAIQAEYYAEAEALLAAGDTVHAAMAFGAAGDYNDASQRSLELWDSIATSNTIALSLHGTVALKSDGTIAAVGDNEYGQFDVSEWKNVKSIASGFSRTYGLLPDGTVLAAGKESEASSWTDVVAISAGGSNIIVGLKTDGTIVVGDGPKFDFAIWTDIVAVSTCDSTIVGLRSDGSVMISGGYEIPTDGRWTDIIAVDAGSSHTVALRADGTVVAVGSDNNEGQCDVAGWKDIVAVSAGHQHSVGLKADGTVVAVGHNSYGQCEVSEWTDIVAVAAGPYFTVGLKADGTLVAVGSDKNDKLDVAGFADIKVPEAQVANLAEHKAEIYTEAETLFAEKRYDEAAEKFRSLGNYEDAPSRINEVIYAKGFDLLNNQSYAEAVTIFTELGAYQDSTQKLTEAKWGLVKTAEVGDVITFGHYEQDGDSSNGAEEIEWFVIDKNGDEVVLFSKYILEQMAFDTKKSNNWSNSSVKTWLNETFLAEAFAENEQERIQSTSAGQVYLLSIDEIEKYFDVDASADFAKIPWQYNGKMRNAYGSYDSKWWWTRTSDGYHNQANCVKYISDTGYMSGGNDASWTGGGVRPAITISITE